MKAEVGEAKKRVGTLRAMVRAAEARADKAAQKALLDGLRSDYQAAKKAYDELLAAPKTRKLG